MKKILCVEDSEDSLYMLHRRLTRAGYDVKVSTNGLDAVDWAKTILPDVILMDVNLPGIDGWEATRRLKRNAETKDIPVIVLTARTAAKSREMAFAAGCDDYDTKPIDFPQLLRKIEAFLGPRAAPAGTRS